MNRSGAFRDLMDIAKHEIERAGGIHSVLTFYRSGTESTQTRYSPVDFDGIQSLCMSTPSGIVVQGFDLYADGVALSRNGAQSVCLIRARFANMRGMSHKWHDIGITPCHGPTPNAAQAKRAKHRALLFQRFIYEMLRSMIDASRSGIRLGGGVVVPRLVCLVADQPQERLFLCLKCARCNVECITCLMVSRSTALTRPMSDDINSGTALADKQERLILRDSTIQCVRPYGTHTIRFFQLSAPVYEAPPELDEHRSEFLFSTAHFTAAKQYLDKTSALYVLPALCARHRMGTTTYHLYNSTELDKLHALDIGLFRVFTGNEFTRLQLNTYNKNLIKKQIWLGLLKIDSNTSVCTQRRSVPTRMRSMQI